MNHELIINSSSTEVTIALLRDKKLIELHKDKHDTSFNVGDIYLGKIRKIVPSLNAAFVDVGYEKDAFLHYLDLGPQFRSQNKYIQSILKGKQQSSNISRLRLEKDINKDGKIKELLSSKQQIAVQVAKEPISSKGPRLSAELTLAGRYIVLVPFTDKISVSQKIKSQEEKERLKKLIASIKPKNFGVIIRTVAENKKVADLDQDLRNLVEKWDKLYQGLKNAQPPKRVLGELNRASTVLRDLLSASFSNIHVNDPKLFEEIKAYVQRIAPKKESIVKLYKGKNEIFEHFGINKQIKASFGKKVMLPSGAYLIIEHTEAMHVIDVNSGNRKASEQNQEQNAIETNLEVAEEIARILRLRDMGGIIAIDFIDMHQRDNNKKLYDKLKQCMSDDRAKHNIIPPTKFGVIELTRQRVRPETEIKTAEVCPTCNGTGEITASILLIDEIENNVRYLVEQVGQKNITLLVHPFVEAYIKKGIKSVQRQWFVKFKKWIAVKGITTLPFLTYKFVDAENEEIEL
ncbi:Rne/Rng family ribonuclease [Parvicella tangerina]|uniref:Ribonuclease G n=1 Tax=Parvicella tangerina TaxID=2829795 RepID=A0A916JNJ6_9FLAO|nr:Rne/Rng family ribonuclease [Parvicella tangerina]CAG5084113.1 Ribonuclease G [Parvicella tangerina]